MLRCCTTELCNTAGALREESAAADLITTGSIEEPSSRHFKIVVSDEGIGVTMSLLPRALRGTQDVSSVHETQWRW